MIPSLVAASLREALGEYLSTTFAIGDDETRVELERFLAGSPGGGGGDGIFRGPFFRIRAPFRGVGEGWKSPLAWSPEGFVPYLHQDRAQRRLSSLNGEPEPTLVTTGTGSGKTECFLHPILDHCARVRGSAGIKAIVLYPMNALANDQARRLAEVIHQDDRLQGIRAGLFVGTGRDGDFQGSGRMGEKEIISDHEILRKSPPDILLTNYRMLDFLLLRQWDAGLWSGTGPDSLKYIVLDEFHTYDGAQGTDVAMLLRRLGSRLGIARPGRPLGNVAPVGTSATLGGGVNAGDMRSFASRVFGVEFPPEAVIGEVRQEIGETLRPVDYGLPVPGLDDIPAVASEADLDSLAVQFIGRVPEDAFDLGDALLAHRLTWAMVEIFSARPRSIEDALDAIVQRAPEWGPWIKRRRGDVVVAVEKYLALMSVARRRTPAGGGPLLALEAQLWVRSVSRLQRALADDPMFRWEEEQPEQQPSVSSDSTRPEVPAEDSPSPHPEPTRPDPHDYAPAIHCGACGRTGWMGRVSEVDGSVEFEGEKIYAESVRRDPRLRAMLAAVDGEAGARTLVVEQRRLLPPGASPEATERGKALLDVLVTPGEEQSKSQTCPACDTDNAIVFVGSGVASLGAVEITNLFQSEFVDGEHRRLLAFSDSVQDASQRAAFFNARTHRFGMRAALVHTFREREGESSITGVGADLLEAAGSRRELHDLTPPDLIEHPEVRTLWGEGVASSEGREVLRRRLDFEAHLEFGLRARQGRTLELTGTATARVTLRDEDQLVATTLELIEEAGDALRLGEGGAGDPVGGADSSSAAAYLHGLLERMRLRGAIRHPGLENYLKHGGKRWRIWGGREEGMPAFPRGMSSPAFPWTGSGNDQLDGIRGAGDSGTATWMTDWAVRALAIGPEVARRLNPRVVNLLDEEGVLFSVEAGGERIYGLVADDVLVSLVEEEGHWPLRCDACAARFAIPLGDPDGWTGSRCLRYRCAGHYRTDPRGTGSYYRNLFRGSTRARVLAAEHVGGLDRRRRDELESGFKRGIEPGDPNVLSCTPTLEMGVDIGDLDAVMLATVPRSPASYLQRVGRAGRKTGNSLVMTIAGNRARERYYLENPQELIDGEVTPPNCWLDAIEILRRQYFAYLLDCTASGRIDAPECPRQMRALASSLAAPGGFLNVLLAAHVKEPDALVAEFTALFGDELQDRTVDRLVEFAQGGLNLRVNEAFERWEERFEELRLRSGRLRQREKDLSGRSSRTDEEEAELTELRGEARVVQRALGDVRTEYSHVGLERIGLLPNYNLGDEGVEFSGMAWSRHRPAGGGDDEAVFVSRDAELRRSASTAIRELAPGASVYVDGLRFRVDHLPVESDPPAHIRVCPDCSFVGGDSVSTCPRCGTERIADASCRHLALSLRRTSSLERADDAHVSDDRDDRVRKPFDVTVGVDVAAEDVQRAWRLKDDRRPFGVEYATGTITWLNLGPSGIYGEPVGVGGHEHRAARFKTCEYCGVVQGAKPKQRGSDQSQHRSSCMTRTAGRNEKWIEPILRHSLRTELVRMILPLADFQATERVESFRAALLLGLKLSLGGSPDHIESLLTDEPGGGDLGTRRRFVVLRDTVPGGTGYLERLADERELRRTLALARDAIARCPCRDRGEVACYRCLLSERTYAGEGVIRRDLAIEMLDELLGRWEEESVEQIPTVGNLPIGAVEESELERRLRAAILAWAKKNERWVSCVEQIGGRRYPEVQLRVPRCDLLTIGDMTAEERSKLEILHYRMRAQRPIGSSPRTLPDFVFTPVNFEGPEVAIYSDGYRYHAAPDVRATLADDARKRNAARVFGVRVWSMNWDDVIDFERAVEKERPMPANELFSAVAAGAVNEVQSSNDGAIPGAVATLNPLAQLLHYLCNPDQDDWLRLGRSALLGWIKGAGVQAHEADSVRSFESISGDGLRVDAVLDGSVERGANAEIWSMRVVLDDSAEAVEDEDAHRRRWREWLWWSNIAQFLDRDGCRSLITAESIEDEEAEAAFAGEPGGGESVGAGEEVALELLAEECAPLVRAAVARGAEMPVVGYEDDAGQVIEAAWPDRKVAVLKPGTDGPQGWDCRGPDGWTEAELLTALGRS